jgi:hypothetical protein
MSPCVNAPCVNVRAWVLCLGALGALSVLGAIEAARADDCLREPGRATAGVRWAYQIDRATNRKCWYRLDTEARAPAAAAAQPSPYDPTPPFGGLFSWWTGGPSNPGGSPSGPVDPRPTSNPRVDDPRIDARPRPLRPTNAEAALTAKPLRPTNAEAALTAKPHRPASAAPVAHADAEPPARLTPTDRDTLFREFLHWQEQQKPQ